MPTTVDLHFPSGRVDAPHIFVGHPDRVAVAGGYRVELERRLAGGVALCVARFTSPEGDVVNVCWRDSNRGDLRLSPMEMLENLTCPEMGRMFNKMTDADEMDMAARLCAVMEAAQIGRADGLVPGKIRLAMTWASMLLTQDIMDAYNSVAAPVKFPPLTVVRLRENGIPPELAVGFVSRRRYFKVSDYTKYGPFAQRGWTGEEFDRFCDAYRNKTSAGRANLEVFPSKVWAQVPCEHAVLGLQANMQPGEVRRMIDAGEWDSAAAGLMAALL